ncbi:unnamed protein product [Effrenium voratum]|nr:unnamed protein product [Effrenium voratum]
MNLMLLFACLWSLACGQVIQSIPRTVHTRVGIINESPTAGPWVIYELRLFFAANCDPQTQIAPFFTDVYDTGTQRETQFETIGANVFDGATWTNWTSDCRVQLGGCEERTVGVGVDISYMDAYIAAVAKKDDLWNVSGPLFDAITVKCFYIWQSADPRHKCDDVGIVRGWKPNNRNDYLYDVVHAFHGVSGGGWSKRPATFDTLWRVTNLEVTLGRWSLSELHFFEDVLCTFPVTGQAFSIGSDDALRDGELNAFDNNVTSVWTARCPDVAGSKAAEIWGDGRRFYGCEPEQAFIGLEFPSASSVRCVRYFQKTPRDITEREQRRSWSAGMGLQRWSGEDWVTTERWWDAKATWGVLEPTLDTPFVGNAPGVWEDLRPPSRSCWRISNDDYTRGQWMVHELEFYSSEHCLEEDSKLRGSPLAMQGPRHLDTRRAFDGDLRQDLAWVSSCSQGLGGGCIPGEAWLGLYVRGQQPDVKCFRILQSKELQRQSSFLSMGMYIDGNWQLHSYHREIGGGTWNRRPALPWTIWRIRNNEEIESQWRVPEVRAYRDPLCLVSMTPGQPLASGYFLGDEPGLAMDDDATSMWTANCDESCNETRKYWIGVELPPDAKDAEAGDLLVRCFRVWQSERMEQQMISTQVQLWNGEIFIISPITQTGSLSDIGGGVWSRPTASFMTRWRLVPDVPEDRHWRLLELELYADSMCQQRLPMAGTFGGESVLASSYVPFVTGFRRAGKGKMWSEAEQLSDEDPTTSILIDHMPGRARPGFLGVDYLSSAMWVRCVKLMQGSMPMEYVPSVRLELWDGKDWRNEDPEMSPVEVQLDGLGGGGWQRRPAQPGSLWRVENADVVPEGWALYEVELHKDSGCTDLLQGEVIASGYAPPASRGPANAVDGNTTTVWLSQCCRVQNLHRPLGFELVEPSIGCNVSDAWVGLDLGARTTVEHVKCVRILQVGFESMQSRSVWVSKWDGRAWQKQWELGGLGGSDWNRRPAAGNTMWRLLYLSRKDVPCPNQLTRITQRPWGISDLKFFSDDDCAEQIPAGASITSGGFDVFTPSAVDQPSYSASRMVDDDLLTTWAANCRTGFELVDTDFTNCSGAWVGMQWSSAREVRCVSMVQSRWESARCCDAADEMQLQRWNGSEWVEASWFRRPPVPAVKTQFNYRDPVHLGAEFKNVGECPSRLSEKRMFQETIVEQRGRRDSEKCIVQLTGAVTLLAEPYCIKHPRCVTVFGTSGTCCPIGDLVESNNRCCCGFLAGEPIFADEISLTDTRDKLSFEFSTIWMSNVLPWVGLAVTVALYLAAILMPIDVEERARLWVLEAMEDSGRRLFLRRLLVIAAWPLLGWRTFLATSKSQVSSIIRWFILPENRLPKPTELYRSLLFLVFGSLLSGMAPWLMLGAIAGEIMIWAALQLCQVIRYFKSPFDPLDLRDQQLRQEVSQVLVNQDDGMSSAFDIAAGVATTIVWGLAFFGKFIFDLLIVRAQMLSVEAIVNIEADKVVELFPGLLQSLREPAMLLYDIMYLTSQLISWTLGQLVGIPLCEGSCALAGSVALVMILYGASQWLNYDLFGLFVAARQVVKATRPECQRILAQSLILLCLGASFAAVQMTMVLFTRALAFANPFVASTWVCPYDDTLAIFVGRILLTGSSILGLIFVFLCVNGHFVGQDYITSRVAGFLGIDLAALDPDGTGDDGGMFRFDVFGAALPTLFGVWWDPWNIDAYLVRERAHVYSMELRDPQACKYCNKIHVRYDLMMTATGRTVSAAVQIVPYGAVVAKACEYLNDPPLIYIGTKMSCMRVHMVERQHTKGTKNALMWAYLFVATLLAHSIEYGVPFLKRATSVSMLVYLFMGVFTLTEENLVEQGTYVILAGFGLSFLKAALEKLIPALLSYGLSGVYFAISRSEGQVTRNTDIPRTITGQVLSGATAASIISGSLLATGWGTTVEAILIGSGGGYAFSLLSLLINALFEQTAPNADEKVKRNVFQLVSKLFMSLLTGGGLGVLAVYAGEAGLAIDSPMADAFEFQKSLGDRWTIRGSIGLGVLAVAIQFITLRLVLVENLPPVVKATINPDYDWRDSPTWLVLRTVLFFPALTAIPTCTLVTVVLRDWIKSLWSFSPIEHQLIMTVAAIVLANVSALTVYRLMNSLPQLIGFFATVLAACMLCPWNFLFGAFTAVWIGVAIGSILEEVVLRRILQREIRRRKDTGEDDEAFVDQQRAACMEDWEKLDDEVEEEVPPEEPNREERLQAYLEIAAAGGSAIEFSKEVFGTESKEAFDMNESKDVIQSESASATDDAVEDEPEECEQPQESLDAGPIVEFFNPMALEDRSEGVSSRAGSKTSRAASWAASRASSRAGSKLSLGSRAPSRAASKALSLQDGAANASPEEEEALRQAALMDAEAGPEGEVEADNRGIPGAIEDIAPQSILRSSASAEMQMELSLTSRTQSSYPLEQLSPQSSPMDELEDGFDFSRDFGGEESFLDNSVMTHRSQLMTQRSQLNTQRSTAAQRAVPDPLAPRLPEGDALAMCLDLRLLQLYREAENLASKLSMLFLPAENCRLQDQSFTGPTQSFAMDPQDLFLATGQGPWSAFRLQGLLNVNDASVDDLMSLPGIGRAKAEKIVAYREQHGAFSTAADLAKVPGIGQRLALNLGGHLCFGDDHGWLDSLGDSCRCSLPQLPGICCCCCWACPWGATSEEAIFFPDESKAGLSRLLRLLDGAKRSLDIAVSSSDCAKSKARPR